MKPSNEELHELIDNYAWAKDHPMLFPVESKQLRQAAAIAHLASAELQRRQQPDINIIHTGKMTPSDEDLQEIMRLAGRKICDLSIIQIGRLNTLSAMYFGYLAKAEYERRQQPELAKHQPCGCVVCTCEDEIQCQGCGATHCGTHPVGQIPVKAYKQQPEASVPAELPEPVRRLLGYAGKQRREVSNPCITAREAITIANWIQAAGGAASVPAELVLELAQYIRKIDGNRTMGAGALAEQIAQWYVAYRRDEAHWQPAVRKGSFSRPPSNTPLLVRLDDGRVLAAMWHEPECGEEAGRFSTCTHERANLISPHVYDDGGFSEIEAVEYLVIKQEPPTC